MAVPSSLSDLSTTAASNSPAGSESIGTSLDDYLRSIQAIIKQGVSKGSDIASASTITPVATSSYFVVTGTTSITAIGETYSWTGRVVVLKFDNTLTLTHSSGLILPGAANISTAAGDVASFVNESTGVWRCVHYQKVSGGEVATSATETFTNKTLLASGSNTVEATSGPGSSAFAFRNKIIGGDFTTNPWQRGTSFTGLANGTYAADRWAVGHVMDGVCDVLKTADAPTVAQAGVYSAHCLHVDVTTADASIAAGQLYVVQQKVEGFNAAPFGFGQAGTRYVTLSFWHKHTKTGTYCVSIRNSAADRSYVSEYTQDTTDTWEKATVTLPVDTSGTWLYDSGTGLNITWAVACGTDRQTTANTWTSGNYLATANQVNALDSTSNNFKIALVQLEAGSVATPFESRPYGVELALCQRYYYRNTPGGTSTTFCSAYAESTTVARVVHPLPVLMRVAPSALEQSGTASDYALRIGGTVTNCSAVPVFNIASQAAAAVSFTVASGLTAGQGGEARLSGATSGYLGWSAEL